MKAAIPLLETRLYAGGRHELLNDTCRDEVIADIAAFILKRS
jgi:alpha-beta hydrolase superfamily lysophospholipase